MVGRRLAPAPLVAGLLIATFVSAQAGEPRAVLELFTSQGCSSCPPADKLLGELSADPSLVALSIPIDYWDYLGLEGHACESVHSARQRAYAHRAATARSIRRRSSSTARRMHSAAIAPQSIARSRRLVRNRA